MMMWVCINMEICYVLDKKKIYCYITILYLNIYVYSSKNISKDMNQNVNSVFYWTGRLYFISFLCIIYVFQSFYNELI